MNFNLLSFIPNYISLIVVSIDNQNSFFNLFENMFQKCSFENMFQKYIVSHKKKTLCSRVFGTEGTIFVQFSCY